MSRSHDHPSYAVSHAKDERAKEVLRLRGVLRQPLYDGPGARRAKKEREADAEKWIKRLRKRAGTPPQGGPR